MLCSSSITLGLCTTIGLCTQTNKHRSSCVTENSCDFVEFDKWYLDWALGVLGNIHILDRSTTQMHFQVRGCSSVRSFVRPSVCPPLDYISSYSSMTRWTRARLAQWFLQIVVAICVGCYATITAWKCMQKARTYFATIAKKNNRNNGFITVAFCKCN